MRQRRSVQSSCAMSLHAAILASSGRRTDGRIFASNRQFAWTNDAWTPDDRLSLQEAEGLLSDTVINLFAALVAHCKPHASRFQDTTHGASVHNGFEYHADARLQIVNIGNLHWLVLSFDPSQNAVTIFDSQQPYKNTFSRHLVRLSSELFRCTSLKYGVCQQQHNGYESRRCKHIKTTSCG